VVWIKVDTSEASGFVRRINLDNVVEIQEAAAHEAPDGERVPLTVEIYTTAPDSMDVDGLPPEARVQACPYVIPLAGEEAESFLQQVEAVG
jgi:hypothetical protein